MGVKYSWWGYVKGLVRSYPENKKVYEDMLLPGGAVLDGMPHQRKNGDVVGAKLAKMETTAAYRDYAAVHSALQICKTINPDFERFVQMYYWQKNRKDSLEDVADKLNYSPETIRHWNKRLLYAIAQRRGLMD